jgi:putative ABC transport system permease protein
VKTRLSVSRRLVLRVANAIRPGWAEPDLAREVRSHLTLLEDEFRRRGMSADEARLAARRAFGGVDQTMERHRETRSVRWLDDVRRDVRYAVRGLRRTPTFTVVAVATLALGIGANAAVFGVLHAAVLRPLPYDEPGRLVRIYQTVGGADSTLDGPSVTALRDRSRTLDVAALYTYSVEGADLTGGPQPERVQTLRVSSDYFRVLRVRPALGRVFGRAEEHRESRVAVVSARIWRSHLGSAPDAAGRFLTLDGVPHRITAVLPDGFDDPLQPGVDVWTALDMAAVAASDLGNFWLTVLARLRPGATLEQAQAEVATIVAGAPGIDARRGAGRSARLAPLQADTVGGTGRLLSMLLGAVGLLLMIACVNVASLFLARGAARQSELAIRAAIGCSRARLVRQLLVESVLLSLAGGLAGVALARVVTHLLLAAAPEELSRISAGTLDATVLVFSAAVALVAGIAFGIAPALQVTQPNLEGVLRDGRRGGTLSRRQTRARSALVVCQMALALVLVIGAGLLLRSFDRLRAVGLGVDAAQVMTFEVNLPSARYADPERRARFHRELQQAIVGLPAVRAAGAVSRLPGTGEYHSWLTRRLDVPSGSRDFVADQRVIEGGYFQALRIPLLRGRTFTAADDAGAPRRVVVSLSLARALFGDEDPIGRTLRATGDAPVCEIIGIVGDVAVSARGATRPTVYHAHQQFAANRNWALTQVIALDRPAPTMLNDLRRVLASIDPALVLHRPGAPGQDLLPLSTIIGGGVANERFALLLMATFAVLALVLAAVGVYGVTSYAVSQRTREMGIRMALGAPASAVRALIVRDAGRLAAIGVLFGVAGGFLATGTLRSFLFDVSPQDPVVFAAAALTIALVALLASWLPARAATKVDPLRAVQSDGR